MTVNGAPEACAGKQGDGEFRDHAHIDCDRGSRAHAKLPEASGGADNLALEVGEREFPLIEAALVDRGGRAGRRPEHLVWREPPVLGESRVDIDIGGRQAVIGPDTAIAVLPAACPR
jgi:hypothetical protein